MADGYLNLGGSGSLTIQSTGTSFAAQYTLDGKYTLGSSHSALTIGKTGNTSEIWLNNTLTVAGPVSVYGGTYIYLGKGITLTQAGAALLFKARGRIETEPSLTFQTNNGNITFWTDSDGVANANGDYIGLQSGVVLNSANGLTNQTTGGGRITLAGGTATDTDGLPTGYAFSNRTTAWGSLAPSGVQLGAWVWNANGTTYANDIKMYSGGGDITIKGKTGNTAPGISWYSGASGSQVINAGSGVITLDGQSSTSHGIELNYYGSTVSPVLQSSSNATTAISITGVTTFTSPSAGYQGTATLIATGTGGISVSGTSAASGYFGLTAGNFKAFAASGAISLTGVNANNASGGLNLSGTLGNGGGITGSTSNITLTGNSVNLAGATTLSTAGAVTIQPSGNDFTSTFTLQNLTFSGNETGLTIGKSATGADGTSDAGVTISSAIGIAGPIAIYGKDLWINKALSTTAANAQVLLKSSGFAWLNDATADVTTNGG